MKKPRRLLAFLFAAAMLLSLLTACSKTPPTPALAENNSKPSMSDSESMDSSTLMPEDGAALKLWFDNPAWCWSAFPMARLYHIPTLANPKSDQYPRKSG